jgi:hypothetical protein
MGDQALLGLAVMALKHSAAQHATWLQDLSERGPAIGTSGIGLIIGLSLLRWPLLRWPLRR